MHSAESPTVDRPVLVVPTVEQPGDHAGAEGDALHAERAAVLAADEADDDTDTSGQRLERASDGSPHEPRSTGIATSERPAHGLATPVLPADQPRRIDAARRDRLVDDRTVRPRHDMAGVAKLGEEMGVGTAGHAEVGVEWDWTPLETPAHHQDRRCGGVGNGRIVRKARSIEEPTGEHPRRRRVVEHREYGTGDDVSTGGALCCDELGQPVGIGPLVVVDEDDRIGAGVQTETHRRVASSTDASLEFDVVEQIPRCVAGGRFDDRAGRAIRVVVDDHDEHLVSTERLEPFEPVEETLQPLRAMVGEGTDSEAHHAAPGEVNANPAADIISSIEPVIQHGADPPGDRRRVLVHDFSGHPFQVQLARSLASTGHLVTHVYCGSFQTPHGAVGEDVSASGFKSLSVDLGHKFAKYSFWRRLRDEIRYGIRFCRLVRRERPDVVISANTPLAAALVIQLYLLVRRVPIVFWQQDIYSMAMRQHLARRAGTIGSIVGAMFQQVEKFLVRTSDWVVVISDDFMATMRGWRVDEARVSVIENWAPLDEVPVVPRPNDWSQRHGFDDVETILLYAGTLGLKHQPSMLLELGRTFADRPDVRVVVASEGIGAEWLRERVTDAREVELFPFQEYSDLPAMLGTGDILLVLLEPGAGMFSVPSKVLTYHCAGQALLGAIPEENLASRIIEDNGSGLVVAPGDTDAFIEAARRLVDDKDSRLAMSSAARSYAERAFDIDLITASFERIIDVCLGNDDDEHNSQSAVAER